MKVMFNRTKTDSFQVGTFDEEKRELVINCPVWQFAKANQIKLTIIEEEVIKEEEIEEVVKPSSEPIPTQEGQAVLRQTEIPNNPPQPNIPPVQEVVNVVQPASVVQQAPPVQELQGPAPIEQPVVQSAPVQQQIPTAFSPANEGLNEIQQPINSGVISIDKVNIKEALDARSITEVEFTTALDMNGYGQFANINAVPDELCKNCLANINAIDTAITEMRKAN